MSILLAKITSKATFPFDYEAVLLSRFSYFVRSHFFFEEKLVTLRKILTLTFVLFTIIAAVIYVFKINLVMFNGKKVPALEAVLRDYEQTEKLKRAELAAFYAPALVKQKALKDGRMVEVSTIKFVHETEAFAANLISAP